MNVEKLYYYEEFPKIANIIKHEKIEFLEELSNNILNQKFKEFPQSEAYKVTNDSFKVSKYIKQALKGDKDAQNSILKSFLEVKGIETSYEITSIENLKDLNILAQGVYLNPNINIKETNYLNIFSGSLIGKSIYPEIMIAKPNVVYYVLTYTDLLKSKDSIEEMEVKVRTKLNSKYNDYIFPN